MLCRQDARQSYGRVAFGFCHCSLMNAKISGKHKGAMLK
jgi:hypothetical protein